MMARVAILIDGDNISADHAVRIAQFGKGKGRVDVHRAYADATNGSGWSAVPGVRLVHAGKGKNAADLLLAIDAMELALSGDFETFLIATSDGDFTHLATRLRERGICVLGIGETKAPTMFRAARTEFLELASKAQTASGKAAPPMQRGIMPLDQQVRTMIAQHSKQGSGIRLVELGPKMRVAHGTRIKDHANTWRQYLAARPMLYDLDPRGPDAFVRFKPDGFGA